MTLEAVRATRARSKGHVGYSGDGDIAAFESRRSRTLAARKARANNRLKSALTAVAENIEPSRTSSTTLE
jgi:hypothetical protein